MKKTRWDKEQYQGTIITRCRDIFHHIWCVDYDIVHGLLYCIHYGTPAPHYKEVMYKVCYEAYFISQMVYKQGDRLAKLSATTYEKEIFTGSAETPFEVFDHVKYFSNPSSLTPSIIEHDYICLQRIQKIWCQMISLVSEQVRIYLLANSAEYVVNHSGNIPEPHFPYKTSLFPDNWSGYNYPEKQFDDLDYLHQTPDDLFDRSLTEYEDFCSWYDPHITFGMTVLNPNKSGLPVEIWSAHAGYKINNPYCSKPWVKIGSQNSNYIFVTIEKNPQIIHKSKGIKRKELLNCQTAIEYVSRNRDIFLRHYIDSDNGFDDEDLLQSLRDRGDYR